MTEKTTPDRFAEMQALAEKTSDPYDLNKLLTDAENAEWQDWEEACIMAGEAWAEKQNEIILYGHESINPLPTIPGPTWMDAFIELWNTCQAKAFGNMVDMAVDDSDIPF